MVAAKTVRITVPPCRYHHSVEMLCGIHKMRDEGCDTVLPGRYATAVTIYNPSACTVVSDPSEVSTMTVAGPGGPICPTISRPCNSSSIVMAWHSNTTIRLAAAA